MKLILTLSAVLAAVLLFMIAVRTPIAFPADANLSTQNAYTDSGELVRAYYRALDGRDIPTAISLVPDDVVLEFTLLNTSTRVKYDGVLDVQHWLESDHSVFSRSVGEVYVIGDRVEFTLTEWVNPRQVGANVPQPVITHWTATLRNNKIKFLTQDPAAD